ncbi:hypothetical protein Taro_009910 [Colocasia esculenta]|uniref:Embryonic stem cell-specific 5-hydroxymethylcytosine-binding protein n=1 Tax=Colocasia esculenta TaxID=4460 RepID=A0A843U675_COLES|nr:hypothetical protein [Colocasia esculenta]
MCGRARCTLRPEQVTWACCAGGPDSRPLATVDLNKYRPSYNVSPGTYLPVVAYRKEKKKAEAGEEDEGKDGERCPVLHCMKWGLVPSFTKKSDKPGHYRMFNARSESIAEKASFRQLLPKNRCLVAVEGFYEWKKDGSKKQPYYIHFQDERPLVFAALYDSWENAEGTWPFIFNLFEWQVTCRNGTVLAVYFLLGRTRVKLQCEEEPLAGQQEVLLGAELLPVT